MLRGWRSAFRWPVVDAVHNPPAKIGAPMIAFGEPANRRRLLAVAAVVGAGRGLRMAWPSQVGPGAAGPADPMIGAPAPPLSGHGPDGVPADLLSLHGMLIMVNVWASWWQSCWEGMPLLLRAQRRWHDMGLRLFGLNTADLPDQVRRFLT